MGLTWGDHRSKIRQEWSFAAGELREVGPRMRRDREMASHISKGAQIGQYTRETWGHIYHLHGAMQLKRLRHKSIPGYPLKFSTFATHKNLPQERHQMLPAIPAFWQRKGPRSIGTCLTSGNGYITFVQPGNQRMFATSLPQGTPSCSTRSAAMKVPRPKNGTRYYQLTFATGPPQGAPYHSTL